MIRIEVIDRTNPVLRDRPPVGGLSFVHVWDRNTSIERSEDSLFDFLAAFDEIKVRRFALAPSVMLIAGSAPFERNHPVFHPRQFLQTFVDVRACAFIKSSVAGSAAKHTLSPS